MIPEEMRPALLGVLPSTLTTCSKNGIPNLTNISRVWYVDEHHVGIANHMLNKSMANVGENPFAFVRIIDHASFATWEMDVEYIGSRTEGTIYEEMKQQHELLSMMAEHPLLMKVRSAEIFRVLSVRVCVEENIQTVADPDIYNELLEALERKWGWDRSVVWCTDSLANHLGEIAALRGLGEDGANQILQRIAMWSFQNKKSIRINHIRSQFRYALSAFNQSQPREDSMMVNQHYVAIPVTGEDGNIVAVVCSQSDDHSRFAMYDEGALDVVSRYLGHFLDNAQQLEDKERTQRIDQTLERIQLEISKRSGHVNTPLSAREVQVAVLVARGLSNSDIANSLFISKRTVTTHIERIYQKLGISSRAALATYVLEQGLSDQS